MRQLRARLRAIAEGAGLEAEDYETSVKRKILLIFQSLSKSPRPLVH